MFGKVEKIVLKAREKLGGVQKFQINLDVFYEKPFTDLLTYNQMCDKTKLILFSWI